MEHEFFDDVDAFIDDIAAYFADQFDRMEQWSASSRANFRAAIRDDCVGMAKVILKRFPKYDIKEFYKKAHMDQPPVHPKEE